MPIEVVLPKVDMDMEDGVIAAWKVAEGAFVRAGDILFEMETNKSVMEVESPGTGTIRGLAGITGDPVAVGSPVAWIDTEAASQSPQADETLVREKTAPARAAGTATAASTAGAVAPDSMGSAESPEGNANPGVEPRQHGRDTTGRAEIRATPSARRIARLRDVDLAAVIGSGPRGRIGATDVESHADGSGVAAARAVMHGIEDLPETLRPGAEEGAAGELVPFSPVRRIVAQRLAESMRTAPHFYLTAQVEMTALLDAIRRLGPGIEARLGVTVLLVHIVGRLLPQHPLLNASIEGDAARFHPRVHIGVAMDRNGDLVVPVLRDVQARPLADLAKEYSRLRDAVRARTIVPSEMRGGTFTISNLGMVGVDAFTAIINQPESAILAIGRTVDTPVGRDGQIVLRPMATLSLSSDHRIVDGVTAARFMAHLRKAIEDPATLL